MSIPSRGEKAHTTWKVYPWGRGSQCTQNTATSRRWLSHGEHRVCSLCSERAVNPLSSISFCLRKVCTSKILYSIVNHIFANEYQKCQETNKSETNLCEWKREAQIKYILCKILILKKYQKYILLFSQLFF